LAGHLLSEEGIRDLQQNAGPVTHEGVCPNRTTVIQVFEDLQALLNNLVRLTASHLGDKANATGIVLVSRVV
jgi:hypothetical protein